MIEDTALTIRKLVDSQTQIDLSQAQNMLNKSNLIKQLLVHPKQSPDLFTGIRAYEWRLLELAEIPFAGTLDIVKEWVNLVVKKTYISEGFSLTGNSDGILACHNSMITKLLIQLGYEDKTKIDAGIDWILKYQSINRSTTCFWTGKDLYVRFGGCMKSTPCYNSIVKSMVTLDSYQKLFGKSNEIENKLQKGLEYILSSQVYKRLSNGQPITSYITKNFYPYSYMTNLLEILTLLKTNNLFEDFRCKDAINLLNQKKDENGNWKSELSQMKSVWVDFDILNKPGAWITYMCEKLFE